MKESLTTMDNYELNALYQIICNRLWYIARSGIVDSCTDYVKLARRKYAVDQFYFSIGGNNFFIAISEGSIIGFVKVCLVLDDYEQVYYGDFPSLVTYKSKFMDQIFNGVIPLVKISGVVGFKCPIMEKLSSMTGRDNLIAPTPTWKTKPVDGYEYRTTNPNSGKPIGSKEVIWNIMNLCRIKSDIVRSLTNTDAGKKKESSRSKKKKQLLDKYEQAMKGKKDESIITGHVGIKHRNGLLGKGSRRKKGASGIFGDYRNTYK